MASAQPVRADEALAFVAVASVWAFVEVALRGGVGWELALAVGSAAALGLAQGLLWTAAIVLPERLPLRARLPARVAIGSAVALVLMGSLDAWTRLGTRNDGLAWMAIVASVATGAAVAWLSARATASAGPGDPRAAPGLARRRRVGALALLVLAVLASWLDRRVFVGLHPAAHSALRAATLAGSSFAVLALVATRPGGRAQQLGLVFAVLLSAMPFVCLAGGRTPDLAALWATPVAADGLDMLRRVTDVDGDGASGWLGGGDCEPWNADVHPAAVELPGNGIDDNCSDGDAVIGRAHVQDVPVPTTVSPRSILLITIETLRADHMSVYGYARDTTPALLEWSKQARVFEHAYTAGGWTSIAIPTLMRGLHARRLSWQPYRETTRGRLIAPDESPTLEPGEQPMQVFMLPAPGGSPPLSWWLQRRGMTTAAVVDDRFSELLDASVGTAFGFDRFVDADQIRGRDPDDQVVDLAIATLRELPRDRAFFLWVHLFGPHSPDTVHEGVPSFGEGIVGGYDHEIRFVDAQVGRLLEVASAEVPSLAWIVTADHGESLREGDRMHGFDLEQGVVHVPLVIGGAGVEPGRVDAAVSAVDVAPTILGLTETPAPVWLDGLDLLARELPTSRTLLVDTWHRSGGGELMFDQVAAIDGEIEMVFETTRNSWGLVDFAAPERTPAEIQSGRELAPMRAAIRAYLDAGPLAVELDR